jgi:hypothetical protein
LDKDAEKALDPSQYSPEAWYCLQRHLRGTLDPVQDIIPYIDVIDIGWIFTDALADILEVREKEVNAENFRRIKQEQLDNYGWMFTNTAKIDYPDFTIKVRSTVDLIGTCECITVEVRKGRKVSTLNYHRSLYTYDNAEELKFKIFEDIDDAIFKVTGEMQ